MHIETVIDKPRRCGLRKAGGLYLVGPELGMPCGLLPLPLDFCPCCGQRVAEGASVIPGYKGLKVARGVTWVQGNILRNGKVCRNEKLTTITSTPAGKRAKPKPLYQVSSCNKCLVARFERAAMMWVGKDNYTVPQYLDEAKEQGISKKIGQLPKGLIPGETVVLLAHADACSIVVPDPQHGKSKVEHRPGVFACFIPSRIEYIVKGTESEKYLQKLVERGITPVQVKVEEVSQPALTITLPDEEKLAAEQAALDY